jgi:hypothetical protein
MSKNIENIDRYLKGVVPPEHVSHQHRQQLCREVLGKIERRQIMSSKSRFWRVAAVLAVLIGAGAIATAVGLKVRKYYFAGRETDGTFNTYKFRSEPETVELEDGSTEVRGTMVGIMSNDPNFTINVEQKITDLEEIDLLRQKDERELVTVIEQEVDGKPQPRTFVFKYVLADGREETMGEGDLRLQQKGKGEYIGIEEKEVRGRVFAFKRQRFVLSDGTEVIVSSGKPQ